MEIHIVIHSFMHLFLSITSGYFLSLSLSLSLYSLLSLSCFWLHNPCLMLIVIRVLPPPSSLCGLDRLSRRRLSLVTRGKDVRWNGSVSDESSVLFFLLLLLLLHLLTSPQAGCLCASPPLHPAPSCSCIR